MHIKKNKQSQLKLQLQTEKHIYQFDVIHSFDCVLSIFHVFGLQSSTLCSAASC